MSRATQFIKHNKLLATVAAAYLVLFAIQPAKAILSLSNSLYYIKEMLTVMPVILLLTALITAWVPKSTIEKNLGQNSGWKGAVFSFLLGSFSAGPIYAAFPVSKALLQKGASIANIVVLLSTWAVVKVPMLLNEAKFLSPKFMAVRWVLTTISIFIMGYLTEKVVKPQHLPTESSDGGTVGDSLSIIREYCIGCGLCTKIAPDYFKMEGNKALVRRQNPGLADALKVQTAIKKCPAQVIRMGTGN